jgi:uncharacterized protein (TIGR02757 family)
LLKKDLKYFLDRKVIEFNRSTFIKNDPICIPHSFSKKQDIEISGFFAAIFAWGNRTTIINKSRELMQLMDNSPYQFIQQHQPSDLKRMTRFKHRTFNTTDLFYFLDFLKHHYSENKSLESAFVPAMNNKKNKDQKGAPDNVEEYLKYFYNYFFSLEHVPKRTLKHIASPQKNSTCKRLNMFLRWMVRNDGKVDFGIWKKISPSQLICPVDVHVARVAKQLGLLNRKPVDWQAATELTNRLREFDRSDPVKYDFALFGLGVMEKS